MRSTSSTILGLLLRVLLCLEIYILDASSLELGLGNLQLCLHSLDMQRLVGGADGLDDGGAGCGRGGRDREGGRGMRLEVHATRGAIRVIAIRLNSPARAADGGAASVGSSALRGVAVPAVALLLVFADEATFLGATETAVRSVYTGLAIEICRKLHWTYTCDACETPGHAPRRSRDCDDHASDPREDLAHAAPPGTSRSKKCQRILLPLPLGGQGARTRP